MNRPFVTRCGVAACSIGLGLSAAAASAAQPSSTPAPASPFAPRVDAAGASAAPRHGHAASRSHVEVRRGDANAQTLVPGAEQELSLQGTCVSSDPDRGSCVGATTYAFDAARIVLESAVGEGAECSLDPAPGAITCALDLRAGESYTMSAKLKSDPDARKTTVIALSAVGNYGVEPAELAIALEPKAALHVTQSPNPTLVQNGAYMPLMKTHVRVFNDGPSAVHDVELTETFSAQPTLNVELDPDPQRVCRGGGTEAIVCRFGRIAPRRVRGYSFGASLPSQVPSSASTATIELSAELGAGDPSTFDLLHLGQEYFGLLDYPDTVERGRTFTAKVEFLNAAAPTARNDAIPLQWTFDGGDDVELIDHHAESKLLECRREDRPNTLTCTSGDITSIVSSGDATLTLRARRSGVLETTLVWSTALWGEHIGHDTLRVDEPPSR